MSSTSYQLIAEAIRSKKQIHSTYSGLHREMCPHVLGYKDGKEQALFVQFGGLSSSKGSITPASAEWRCIPVGNLSNIKLVDGPWYTLETQNKRRTSCVDQIDVEVSI